MLGRLCMTVDECIEAYIKTMSLMYKRNSRLWVMKSLLGSEDASRFDSKALEESLKAIIEQRGLESGSLLLEENPTCRV
jgi:hypothetical protein